MIQRPTRPTLTDTLFPYTTLFRSKAATGGLTQDVAKGGGQQGDAMLLLAPQSYDGSLAVALRLKRRQGGKREPGDQFTNGGAGGNELTEIVMIATDQRILYHRGIGRATCRGRVCQ